LNLRDAINEILLSINEMPLDIEDSVEDIQTAIIVNKQLEISKRNILSQGWYFNKTKRYLKPDLSGYIPIPSTFLSVDGSDAYESIVIRDNKLFDKSKLVYKFTEPIECEIVEDMTFDDIPYIFADYIVKAASLNTYVNIIGYTRDISIRTDVVALARADAIREDARNTDGNILSSDFLTSLIDRTSM